MIKSIFQHWGIVISIFFKSQSSMKKENQLKN